MICWILKTQLDSYKYLCAQEGSDPHIIEETEDKVHVQMSANTAQTWNMVGYWYEMG